LRLREKPAIINRHRNNYLYWVGDIVLGSNGIGFNWIFAGCLQSNESFLASVAVGLPYKE
jgi:hypothetical protein